MFSRSDCFSLRLVVPALKLLYLQHRNLCVVICSSQDYTNILPVLSVTVGLPVGEPTNPIVGRLAEATKLEATEAARVLLVPGKACGWTVEVTGGQGALVKAGGGIDTH